MPCLDEREKNFFCYVFSFPVDKTFLFYGNMDK